MGPKTPLIDPSPLVVRLGFSSVLHIRYVEVRISQSVSEGPFDFEITRVDCILKTLQTGKATGPDYIDDRLLKELARPLSAPLTDLFSFLLLRAKFQISGNRPMLLLFLKRMTTYRHIFLLKTLGKVLDKNILEHVYNVLNDHLINTLQSSFDPGDSSVNQLVDLYTL